MYPEEGIARVAHMGSLCLTYEGTACVGLHELSIPRLGEGACVDTASTRASCMGQRLKDSGRWLEELATFSCWTH